MSKLLSIPILTAYVYILTVVTYYGYNSYFNIPYDYISFSPKEPIIFFFDFSRLIFTVVGHFSKGLIVLLVISILILLVLFFFSKVGRFFITTALIALAAYLPFAFYNFGTFLASAVTSFYTAPSKCIPGATDDMYIAPTLYDSKMIFVPIDKTTLHIKNGLLVRDSSSITCELQKIEIGHILK